LLAEARPSDHRLAEEGVAPFVQTISDGKAHEATDSAATADGRVDDPAFIQQQHLHSSSSSATTGDAEMNQERQAGDNCATLHYANESKENLDFHSANSGNAGDTHMRIQRPLC
jgi:hypothetical protein